MKKSFVLLLIGLAALLLQGCLTPTPVVRIITATPRPIVPTRPPLPTPSATPESVTIANLVSDKDMCTFLGQTVKNVTVSGTLLAPAASTCRKIENDVRCSAALSDGSLSLLLFIMAGEGANTIVPLLDKYKPEDLQVTTNTKSIAKNNDAVTVTGSVLVNEKNECALAVNLIVKKP